MSITFTQVHPLIGNKFQVQTTIGEIELELLEAEERPRRGLPESFRTPLLLIFASSSKLALAQDNYIVEHPALGKNIWTIAPALPDHAKGQHQRLHEDGGACLYYQVLFN
ncbi:DUF6916 family protein [Undibacterium sp. JH2W]|uniref:DUF6916 family protein n=1 Tax=Undibacterium sp. JH2W TaxID=3413037 RepID=UPI003BF43369